MKVYLVNYNFDYSETMKVYTSENEMLLEIAESFDLETFGDTGDLSFEEYFGTDQFWDDVEVAYEHLDVKGLNIAMLDTETMEIRDLTRSELTKHQS